MEISACALNREILRLTAQENSENFQAFFGIQLTNPPGRL